ncbi:MAG: DUF488 family protein [Dissulfurispiraceae bacterium]
MKKVYTLGTGLRSQEDFVEILTDYDIKTVVDVRSFPKSKMQLFSRVNLQELLRLEGINYSYLGTDLGGLQRGGYAAYTSTDAFRVGIEKLEGIIDGSLSVILCAEKLPWKCHRKWIARELTKRGWDCVHIIDKDKVWEPH